MVYKNIQYAINLFTINITEWGTQKKVVENTSQRPDIIGRVARKQFGSSIGDPFCWGSSIHWCILSLEMTSLCNDTLHPQWHFSGTSKYRL